MVKFERMDIQTRKINFVKSFLNIKNDNIILSLEHLLTVELENEISPMDMETFNNRIDQSISDSMADKVTSNVELLEEIKKWA